MLPSLFLALVLVLAPLAPAVAGDLATLPILDSAAGDAFTEAEREAVAAWSLAQPEVTAAIGDHRTRLLRLGSDQAKRKEGGEYRRASLYIRDYDSGRTHVVTVDLETGSISIWEHRGLVQASEEELAEAWEILREDPEVEALFLDPALEVTGGFVNRSPHADDPCHRDVCVQIEVARRRPGQGFARRMVVNLSTGTIANLDFQTPRSGEEPTRLTDPRLLEQGAADPDRGDR